jgi:hypothetical protein
MMRLLFAYIDPGAGSLVIQAVIATLVSLPFFFRKSFRSAVDRFRRAPMASDEKSSQPAEPE